MEIIANKYNVIETEKLVKNVNSGGSTSNISDKENAANLTKKLAKNINHNDDYADYEDALAEYFLGINADVKIQHSNSNGKIVIKFKDYNDFKKIYKPITNKK